MAPVDYRLGELERRIERLEDRIAAMRFGEVEQEIRYVREDVADLKAEAKERDEKLDSKMGRIQWLLVTTVASVGASAIVIALSVGVK